MEKLHFAYVIRKNKGLKLYFAYEKYAEKIMAFCAKVGKGRSALSSVSHICTTYVSLWKKLSEFYTGLTARLSAFLDRSDQLINLQREGL